MSITSKKKEMLCLPLGCRRGELECSINRAYIRAELGEEGLERSRQATASNIGNVLFMIKRE